VVEIDAGLKPVSNLVFRTEADPPFGFAQGRLFGDDNKKGNDKGERRGVEADFSV
jgi:hypothetical protein